MNLHVIIPMAGLGSRFSQNGFKTPKHMLPVDINGNTMISEAIKTLNAPVNTKYTFVTLKNQLST